jgi:histidine triad (HIT) family protein
LCEAVAGRTEKSIVEETDHTATIVNWKQFELGQIYMVIKRHAPTILDLTEEKATSVMQAVRRTAAALVRAYDPDGINLIHNNGRVLGQEAPHFHLHVVPRRKVGSEWDNGTPHSAVLEGKVPTHPTRDVLISVEREREIAKYIGSHILH